MANITICDPKLEVPITAVKQSFKQQTFKQWKPKVKKNKTYEPVSAAPQLVMVEESILMQLLKKPSQCTHFLTVKKKESGHATTYIRQCSTCQTSERWCTSSFNCKSGKPTHTINQIVASAWLCIGLSFQTYQSFFSTIKSQALCKTTFYTIQERLAPIVVGLNDLELKASSMLAKPVQVVVDARYDSPRCAEHCTVTLMDYQSKKIIAVQSGHCLSATDKNGVLNNFAGSLEGSLALKALESLRGRFMVDALINDGGSVYPTVLAEAKHKGYVLPECRLLLDPWHFGKCICKKAPKVAKGINISSLKKKIKNHLQSCITQCEGDAKLLMELWNNAPLHWHNNLLEKNKTCDGLSPRKIKKENSA